MFIRSAHVRASGIEVYETAPQVEMNFLQEIAPALRVCLIGPREALQCRAMFVGGLPPVLLLPESYAHVFPKLS
jgi:hypothetical protein